MAYQDFNSVDTPTYPFAKDPGDKLAYSFDFSELLGGLTIDPETVDVVCDDADVQVTNAHLNEETNVLSALVAGGESGTYVVLTFKANLSNTGKLERDVRLRIENR